MNIKWDDMSTVPEVTAVPYSSYYTDAKGCEELKVSLTSCMLDCEFPPQSQQQPSIPSRLTRYWKNKEENLKNLLVTKR